MNKELVVLQPDPIVELARYQSWLDSNDVRYSVYRLWEDDAIPALNPRIQALLILGGRMSALDSEELAWMSELTKRLPELVAKGLHVFGICLGHQILANALGGEVTVGHPSAGEDGPRQIQFTDAAVSDPVFTVIAEKHASNAWVYESHNDVVTRLPVGAIHLARSSACEVQAFRFKNAWGVQFHPEATPAVMEFWENNHGGNGVAMRSQCEDVYDEAGCLGDELIAAFTSCASLRS